jgi:thiamine pyrophosphate-dependent acetolactate synthase large subunit-like protein
MKVGEAVGHALVQEGVRLAAGLAGTHIGQIIDAIAAREEVSLMYARQERVALDICDGYARASGNPAVVFTDSGPAAANLMGGLVNSWGDSTPLLFFAGHVDRTEVMKAGTKEIPFLDLFRPVSKWAEVIMDPAQTAEIMRRAFIHLRTGRPGPVVIGMPLDVSLMDVGNFEYRAISSMPRIRSGADPSAVNTAVEMIARARRPHLYVGAGVLQSEATPELVRLAEMLSIPVATTLNGKSAFPENHPLAVGLGGFTRGFYGSLPAAEWADAADVIMTIGCGFKLHTVFGRPKQALKHIQIDVDPKELHRDHFADLALLGDAKIVLGQMVEAAKATLPKARLEPVSSRFTQLKKLKKRWADVSKQFLESDEVPINPFRVTHELMKLADPANTILLHDAGTVRGTTSQHYITTQPRTFLGFGGQSAMGWTIGAAMGAKKARPEHLVVAVVGEEAFNETAMDVDTSIRNNAPVLYIVKNNRRKIDESGGKNERLAYARFHTGIDLGAFVPALGARYHRIEKPDELAVGLAEAIAEVKGGATAVVDVGTTRMRPSLYRFWDKNAGAGE